MNCPTSVVHMNQRSPRVFSDWSENILLNQQNVFRLYLKKIKYSYILTFKY